MRTNKIEFGLLSVVWLVLLCNVSIQATSSLNRNSTLNQTSFLSSANDKCRLKFVEGDLILQSQNDNVTLWSAGVTNALLLNLSDTGDLNLYDGNGSVLWTPSLNGETCQPETLKVEEDECKLNLTCGNSVSRWTVERDIQVTTQSVSNGDSSTTNSITDSTTVSNTDSTTESNTDSTSDGNTDSTTDEIIELTTDSITDRPTTNPTTQTRTNAQTTKGPIIDLPPKESSEVNIASDQTPLPECFYASSDTISNVNDSETINRRCLQHFSSRTFKIAGSKHINFDNQICGVLNASDAEYSEICFRSVGNNKINKSLFHLMTLNDETYTSDYKFVSKPKFQSLKIEIETKYNKLASSDSNLLNLGFERAIVLELLEDTSGTSKRRKRSADPNAKKTVAKIVVQFRKSDTTNDTYAVAFDTATGGGTELDGMSITSAYEEVGECPEIRTIFNGLPQDIIDQIFDNSTTTERGSTFDLTCPNGKKLSDDEDGFDPDDDIYQLLCNSQGSYVSPSEWPTCVNFCPKDLPTHDDNGNAIPPMHSGLMPLNGTNTVAVGKYGRYRCIDGTFGVDAGESDIYEIECVNYNATIGKYNIKENPHYWPICSRKTTTISPIIPIAVGNMLERYTWSINYRHQVYRNTDQDEEFQVLEPENYLRTVTAPAVLILIICILMCLCCTRNDSPLCSICNDTGVVKERVLIPVKD